jgi:hypothetical protein
MAGYQRPSALLRHLYLKLLHLKAGDRALAIYVYFIHDSGSISWDEDELHGAERAAGCGHRMGMDDRHTFTASLVRGVAIKFMVGTGTDGA